MMSTGIGCSPRCQKHILKQTLLEELTVYYFFILFPNAGAFTYDRTGDDLLRHSRLKHEQGAYTEARVLRTKAAIDKLFRGETLRIHRDPTALADSCVGQCDREATLHHYDSAIRKYECLGVAHAEAAETYRKLRRDAAERRQFGLWCDLSDPSVMIRQAGDLAEQAPNRNDFATAT
ncbi:hypothetical protein FS749_007778 [Ceratobasidium sp. UAMH 11750]|nr:hypothetical protein FS749_007778 [Ceratobasidium sp. UAMH 11750]